jgi:hypothetical protein
MELHQFNMFIAKLEDIRHEIKNLNSSPNNEIIAHGNVFTKEEFKNKIKEDLFTMLEIKTGWERNEIKTLIQLALDKI